MDIRVKNNGLILVKSDSVLSLDNQPISIILDGKYTIVFSFKDDPNNSGNTVDINPNDSGVEFVLNNFNNPIGTAIAKPIEFAKINNKPISISFGVYAIATSKFLHYNIYLGE